jgi:hypothetical protein
MSAAVVRRLELVGARLAAARKEAAQAMSGAKKAGLAALDDGVSEVDVAAALGVDRMTVRKWQGKR